MEKNSQPLIYSCSGCSNNAQLANRIAVDLSKEGIAEMSCIAGLGGDVKPLVNKAKRAKAIMAIDGCHLHCVKNTLARHDIKPSWHVTLTDFGIKKQYHKDFSEGELDQAKSLVLREMSLG